MNTLSLTLTQKEINDLKTRHKHGKFRYDIPHTQFQVKGSDYTITVYKSRKTVFQAQDLELLVAPYQTATPIIDNKPPISMDDKLPMAGSDEVGTGDYFGPVTVCACIVTAENAKQLPLNLILDSKAMKDNVICELAPKLMAVLDYSLLILDNKTYNIVHQSQNLNTIKAKLHNQAYLNLAKKASIPEHAIVDQFMPKQSYYKAIQGEPQVYQPLHFETKAESKYIAVACASVIARYAFLEALKQLGAHYNVDFPKGAGSHVDSFGRDFVATHSEASLNQVAKLHFKNTQRIINS